MYYMERTMSSSKTRADRQLGRLRPLRTLRSPSMNRSSPNTPAFRASADQGLFSSATARPQHRAADGGRPDAAHLAAAYAFSLARNHPFLDGNKRTAFVVMDLFADLNRWKLEADDAECISAIESVAAQGLPETNLAVRVRSHIARE
jgi:death on curing protein